MTSVERYELPPLSVGDAAVRESPKMPPLRAKVARLTTGAIRAIVGVAPIRGVCSELCGRVRALEPGSSDIVGTGAKVIFRRHRR